MSRWFDVAGRHPRRDGLSTSSVIPPYFFIPRTSREMTRGWRPEGQHEWCVELVGLSAWSEPLVASSRNLYGPADSGPRGGKPWWMYPTALNIKVNCSGRASRCGARRRLSRCLAGACRPLQRGGPAGDHGNWLGHVLDAARHRPRDARHDQPDDAVGVEPRPHPRAALTNGVTRDEINEVLMRVGAYRGIPLPGSVQDRHRSVQGSQ